MVKGKPNAKYVRFTEELNALDYLEAAYDATRRVPRDRTAWKWVAIGLHGALYGFAICALKGTDWTLVTRKNTRLLISFDEAIKRCQSATRYGRPRPAHITEAQKDALRFLKRIRNQLAHYTPLAWNIEEHGLVTSAIDALDVIRMLALETGDVRLNAAQKQTVELRTQKGKQLLQSTQLYKDYLAALKKREKASRTPQNGIRS